MIHLDANVLIAVLRSEESAKDLQRHGADQHVGISAIAWSEFLCGPVLPAEAMAGRSVVDTVEPLTESDAELAADLFNRTGRRIRSLRDCMIAAVAIRCGASLAAVNLADFRRFEPFGLRLL